MSADAYQLLLQALPPVVERQNRTIRVLQSIVLALVGLILMGAVALAAHETARIEYAGRAMIAYREGLAEGVEVGRAQERQSQAIYQVRERNAAVEAAGQAVSLYVEENPPVSVMASPQPTAYHPDCLQFESVMRDVERAFCSNYANLSGDGQAVCIEVGDTIALDCRSVSVCEAEL